MTALSPAPATPRLSLLHGLAAGWDFGGYLRRRARRSDPFAVGFPGFPPVLFTGTAEGARELFRAPTALVGPPLPNPIEPMVGAASLILSSGERHRTDRALLAPALHAQRVRALAPVIRDATLREIDGRPAGSWQVGSRIDGLAAAHSITLRVILAAVFGTKFDRESEYAGAVADFLATFTTPLLVAPVIRRRMGGFGPWQRFVAARTRLDRLLLAEITRRRRVSGSEAADLLDLLLTIRYDDGSVLTDTELCEHLRALLVAGHETAATTLTWALYHLHREPGLLARVTAELAAAGDDPAEQATLPLLGAVCQETLRLHPPVPIVLRMLTEPWRWRGVDVAAGQTIGLAVGVLHSQPSIWPAPRLFHPDRFLDRKVSPFEFAPFGGGHRRCIGVTLAEYELRIVLATLLTEVRLSLDPDLALGRRPRTVPRNIAVAPDRAIHFTRTA
ncbi:cytochrome P450 [Nocardia rhizosphaerihabitans]|uniref:Cytochrome P450 n=1 Tax=Nocardia rhizosphaerihabitans TaxID=1691570 RepID=A0ABQ2KMT7_9NOCA|nr:cytochrome P450 [Nocardia rhizosphaerihabitans]GGN88039.1 cytochrome P450 [Nocardia rhizosphaerihabitans]